MAGVDAQVWGSAARFIKRQMDAAHAPTDQHQFRINPKGQDVAMTLPMLIADPDTLAALRSLSAEVAATLAIGDPH